MAFAIYCALSVLQSNYEHYNENPIVGSVEKNFRNWTFNVPAVTVCLVDKVDEVKANDYIQRTWGNVSDERRSYLMKFINTAANMTYRKLSDFKEFADDSKLENIDMVDMVQKVYKDWTIITTSTGKRADSEKEFSINEFGFCQTIYSIIEHYIEPINNTILPHSASPCHYIYIVCYLYLAVPENTYFTIHSMYEVPDSSNKISSAAVKMSTDVVAINVEMVTSPKVRELPPKRRRCLYMDEGKDYNFPVYSYSLCITKCRLKYAIRLCGCSPPFYYHFNIAGKYKICNAKGLVCISNYSKFILKLRNINGEKIDCKCFDDCESTKFKIIKENMISWSNRNTSLIHINVESARTRYKKDVLYTLEDFLVSFGSTVGFFLGCSILSVFEVISFFTLRLFFYLRKRLQIRNAPEPRRRRFIAFTETC